MLDPIGACPAASMWPPRWVIAMSPVPHATRITADDDGITLTDGEGSSVTYPHRR